MKKIEEFGISVPEILLPKNIDVSTWSVIACDQYTQDHDYWKKAEETAANKASTLNLILPEVYLNAPDKSERIKKIQQTMKEYLADGVFAPERKCMVYLERKTAFGRMRKGLVLQIDLESYEWKPFSKANIRATEATIVDRIPPRKEIRKGAAIELPHIMLLVNDKENLLIGSAAELSKGKVPLYQGKLMCNGGEISGWAIETDEEINKITSAIEKIAEKNKNPDGSTFLFAVGDGNHSLATAKAVWEDHKAELLKAGAGEEELKNSPVRYALVEIVNIYDSGLTFEPIHRVIFNADTEKLVNYLCEKLEGSVKEVANQEQLEKEVHNSWANFGFDYVDEAGKTRYLLLQTGIKELAVARLQPLIDDFLKENKGPDGKASEIDYIHGSQEVLSLGSRKGATGILLPPIAKDSFFETINGRGPLPRKSFSMGEADEKRFYLECRKLF